MTKLPMYIVKLLYFIYKRQTQVQIVAGDEEKQQKFKKFFHCLVIFCYVNLLVGILFPAVWGNYFLFNML